MPYRRSGVQYDTNHILHPKSPQDPIFSATSTPYLSSSPIFVRTNRDLVSAKVGPDSHDMTAPNSGNSVPPNRLLPPLELISKPSVPLQSFGIDRPIVPTIKDAISFLEWNGYICQPRSFLSPAQSSTDSTSNKSANNGTPVLNDARPNPKDKREREGKRIQKVRRRRKLLRRSASSSIKIGKQYTLISCNGVTQLEVQIGKM